MKMTKENMDHIKERFEKETGTVLPKKEPLVLTPYAARILTAAAGLVCLVGLGLVWHKVSVDKQNTANTLLAYGEVSYEETAAETEEAAVAENEEENDIPENTSDEPAPDNDDATTDYELSYEVEVPDDVTEGTLRDLHMTLFAKLNEAEELVDVSLFGADTDWTWPVSSSDHVVLSYSSDPDAPDGPFHSLSIPGNVGDEVVAMHACSVTKTGFDTKDGNYVITEVNGNSIKYSHLDTICVSEGEHLNTGEKLGTLGNTGASTGPHLGIEASNEFGNAVRLINVPTEEEGFYSEEVIEE